MQTHRNTHTHIHNDPERKINKLNGISTIRYYLERKGVIKE